jgi:hypothetical protein
MLNLWEDHVFVELNYPHIIGISGYERHHDVATLSAESGGTCPRTRMEILAPIVPKARDQTQVKPWRSKGRNRLKVLKA